MISPSTAPLSATAIYWRLVGVALFWGGTFIAGRVLADSVPPMTAATIRFAIAAALLLIVAYRLEGGLPRLTRSQALTTLALGATGIAAYNFFFFSALAYMLAGRTALLVTLNPIVTALFLALFFGERLGARRWLGIALAFSGAAIVVTRGDPLSALGDISRSIGTGEALMSAAVLSFAAYGIIGRYALTGLSPIAATTYASLWGLLLLAIGAALEWPRFHPSGMHAADLAALAYLGVLGTVVAFIWYYDGVRAIGASRTAVFINLVPIFGVALAAGLLGEPILPSMLIGGAITILGVMLTNRTPAAPTTADPVPPPKG